MGMKNAEGIISEINRNVFFKEFTFSKNDFKVPGTKQELEFADNVVWLDDLLFLIQIKERIATDSIDSKWFENKVLKKGVKQIKATLQYLDTYPEIKIKNDKGHILNVAEAKNSLSLRTIIIYSSIHDIPEELRMTKFYDSSEVGLIHLFHAEDYFWICRYLITPTEIDEYLEFRENFSLHNTTLSNRLPEQYYLGHFFETLEVDHFNPSYINNLQKASTEAKEFDISFLIENFSNKIKLLNYATEYYYIIKEIALLNRAELFEFKKRLIKAVQVCKDNLLQIPYRVYFPKTDCAFVFIPLHEKYSQNWKTALQNYVIAQKYDQKASKCIGVVIFKEEISSYYEMFWLLIESEWVFNEEVEQILKNNFPFREVRTKRVDNRYKTG